MKIQELCKEKGVTMTEMGRACYPELPANRAYMKIHRMFTMKPKYVEIKALKICADLLQESPETILQVIDPAPLS